MQLENVNCNFKITNAIFIMKVCAISFIIVLCEKCLGEFPKHNVSKNARFLLQSYYLIWPKTGLMSKKLVYVTNLHFFIISHASRDC